MLRTESGNVLVNLGGDAKNKVLFTDALKKAVVDAVGELKNLNAKETVMIVDFTNDNNVDQIAEAVKNLLPEYMDDPKVMLSNSWRCAAGRE